MSGLAVSLARQPERFACALRLSDVVLLVASAHAATVLQFGTTYSITSPHILLPVWIAGMLALTLLPKCRLYALNEIGTDKRVLLTLSLAMALILGIAAALASFLGQRSIPESPWLFLWFALALTGMGITHLAARALLKYSWRSGQARIRVLIIGAGAADELCQRVRMANDGRYHIQAICYTHPEHRHPPAGIDMLASPHRVADYVTRCPVDQIWLALPLSDGREIVTLQHLLRNTMVDIRWVQDTRDLQILHLNLRTLFGFPVMDLNCLVPDPWRCIEKYLFDQLVAISALLLLSPLMVLIALAIRIDSPGPVIFTQPRVGLNGRPFKLYKFRSMYVHDDAGTPQARRDDPRVTPLGRLLRRTSLDELPQFFNVLRGDMSVVGPRPHTLTHTELYRSLLDVYMVRHRAMPGITGWAQINGARGETDTPEKMLQRVQLDLYYMQHWSIWLDLRIVLWTACNGWTGKHVY